MDALANLRTRRSVRRYLDRPIAREDLQVIVDAARFAPTARNLQPWQFVVITKEETLKKLAALADHGRFLAGARAGIAVFCSNTGYYLEDGCAATCNILLAATALGIGSCWIAGDKKPYCAEVAGILNAPPDSKLISLIALGYPEDISVFRPADKKALGDLMHWEQF